MHRLHLTERPRLIQTLMAGLPVRWFASRGVVTNGPARCASAAVKLNVEPRREPRSTVALRLPPFEGRPIVVQLSLAYGFIARGLLGSARAKIARTSPEQVGFSSNSEDGPLNDFAVRVPEIEKLKEIVQLQVNLWHAVQRLPAGAEREDALREIRGFQHRIITFIRRRWQT